MFMNVITEPADISFDKAGVKGKIFPTDQLTNSAEFILISTDQGHETKIIQHKSTFSYYVIEGSGHFEIEDIIQECKTGDMVVIPAGSKFRYSGRLKLLLIVTPPWREDQEETIY